MDWISDDTVVIKFIRFDTSIIVMFLQSPCQLHTKRGEMTCLRFF